MKESAWNKVIWTAIIDLQSLTYQQDCKYSEYKYYSIDEIFLDCENKLRMLNAPAKEIELRLFALALHCDKMYNLAFFNSLAFSRFAAALNFFHFEYTAKRLIKENSLALVVFWAVLRLSLGDTIPHNTYFSLEKEMKSKSLELCSGFTIFIP